MEDTEESTPPAPIAEPRAPRAGFGLGLLVGILVGASVALLLAPEPGRDTRRRLRRRLGSMRERVSDGIEDLDHRIRAEISRRR